MVALWLGVKAVLRAEGLHQPYLIFVWLLYYFKFLISAMFLAILNCSMWGDSGSGKTTAVC